MEVLLTEITQRHKIEEKMIELLGPFYAMLDGYNHLTENIKQKYLNLIEIICGTKHVSWQDENKYISNENGSESYDIPGCSVLKCKYF